MNTTLLSQALERRDMTIAQAAKLSGLSYQCIFQHVKGKRKVSANDAIRYERLLMIPRSELRPDLWPLDRWHDETLLTY